MTSILEHPVVLEPFVVDDAAARRTLREQIARLDEELSALGAPMPAPVARGRGAGLLGLTGLERIRDSLVARAADARAELDARGRVQEELLCAREEMLADPAAHPFARVTNEDVGEPGCCDWHVRPRFGLLGMLAGWWRVVVSSGCPLWSLGRGSPFGAGRDSFGRVIAEGAEAPDFELEDQDGAAVKLSDLRGSPVVLYFYPKADTPGCTTQACGIRDRSGEYERFGARVLGVSPDKPAKLRKFADKYGLPFTLLADTEHAVADEYGAWVEKSMYGRTYWGNARATFVIDADGKIARVFPKVSPKTHDDVVLDALADVAARA